MVRKQEARFAASSIEDQGLANRYRDHLVSDFRSGIFDRRFELAKQAHGVVQR